MSRGIPQMILGQRQRKEGKELQDSYARQRPIWDAQYEDRTKRFRSEIDANSEKSLGRYEALAKQGIGQEQKDQFSRNVDRGTANSLAGANSRRGGLVGVGVMNQSANDAYSDLLAQDASARMQNEYNLAAAGERLDSQGTAFSYGREAGRENLYLQDLYDLRDRGFATEQAGYENISQGWAQLDSDIMSWMTMGGMGGGGGGTNTETNISSGNDKQKRTESGQSGRNQTAMQNNKRGMQTESNANNGNAYANYSGNYNNNQNSSFGGNQQNQSWSGYGGNNQGWKLNGQ